MRKIADEGRLSMAKSRSGGAFLNDGQYQCLPMTMAERLPMAPWELPIDPRRCPGRLRRDSFVFFLVI